MPAKRPASTDGLTGLRLDKAEVDILPYAIELFMDVVGDTAVRSIWQQIKNVGISDYLVSCGSRPHVTLAVYDKLHVESFRDRLLVFAKKIEPIKVNFNLVEEFPGQLSTIFLSPTANDDLDFAQKCYWKYFDDTRAEVQEFYSPFYWKPHCTLATDIQDRVLSDVWSICNQLLPIEAVLMSIGIVEFRPVRHLFCCDLGNR